MKKRDAIYLTVNEVFLFFLGLQNYVKNNYLHSSPSKLR